MNQDTLFDKKINPHHLLADLQHLPSSIYSVLTSINDPLLLLDNDLTILFLNTRAKEIVRKISGNSISPGTFLPDVFPAVYASKLKVCLQEALAGKNVNREIEIAKGSFSIFLECSCKPLKAEQVIIGVCLIFKDITLVRQLEEKERTQNLVEDKNFHSKKLFETFMENTPLTAWVTDGAGMMLYLNPAFRKLYNIPLDNLPRYLHELFPKDLVDEYLENNLLAIKSGRMVEVVERTLKPDGTMAIYKVFKFPMSMGDETVVGGWALEITEETKLQEQLTNSIERYSYVNEATSDAIYDWEISNNMLYRGKGFAILFGYHDPYVPLDFRFSRIHPGDVAEVKKVYLSALEDPALRRWKIKYRFKDAKDVYKNVVDKAFIIRENGKLVRVIGAIQDITEYNQLQEKLILQEESKKRAIIRSIIETQEKERRQLSVELHDNVNQILSSCKLMLEVAKDNKDKAPLLTEKSYQSIQLAIAEIRKISHDLNPSSVEDFGLKEAITEMIDKINLSGRLKITFRFSTKGKKLHLKSEDKIAVYRIVQEQLNNIMKHAQARIVLVDLSIKSSVVNLVIEDDGKGFNPKKTNKGIGLKNIHHRVEYYHGSLDIETAQNKGCKMSIVLNIASNR